MTLLARSIFGATLAALVWVGPAAAGEPKTRTCALRVSEARFALDNRREDERLVPLELAANQAVLALVEPLWKARLTERLRYLAARHQRDRSRVLVGRATVLRKRAEAKIEVLTAECFDQAEDPIEALARYTALGCELTEHERQLAAVDLAYRSEVLASTEELRARELATAQELIRATFAADRAATRLEMRTERTRECAKPAQ